MESVEFRVWRKRLALTQQEAATALGVSRLTVAMYERGYRHDDKRPVIIPKTVELACAAVFLNIVSFSGDEVVFDGKAEQNEKAEKLPSNAVPKQFAAAALHILERRGVIIGSHLTFPLDVFLLLWGEIEAWCRDQFKEGQYDFRPVPLLDAPGKGVAVMQFADDTLGAAFKLRWS